MFCYILYIIRARKSISNILRHNFYCRHKRFKVTLTRSNEMQKNLLYFCFYRLVHFKKKKKILHLKTQCRALSEFPPFKGFLCFPIFTLHANFVLFFTVVGIYHFFKNILSYILLILPFYSSCLQ